MASWSGQDWALLLGGITVFLTGIGGFITSMVTLVRLGTVAQKVDGMLLQRDASKKAEGVVIGRQAGDDAAAQRDEGARAERELNRPAAAPNGTPVVPQGSDELPVKDDRVAKASEEGAAALGRMATATETATKTAAKAAKKPKGK